MGLMSRTTDAIYAFRFLRLLTTPWDKTSAYKNGLINDKGRKIRKPITSDEKSSYNMFHRVVFNLKKIISKSPVGSRYVASYAAALYLIREETGMSEAIIRETVAKYGIVEGDLQLTECFYLQESKLLEGTYRLIHDVCDQITGDPIALKGTKISVPEHLTPVATCFNAHLYEVLHPKTNRFIIVSAGDLIR